MCEHVWELIDFDGGYFEQCSKCLSGLRPQLTPFQKTAVRVSKDLLELSKQRSFFKWDNETFLEAQRFWLEINSKKL